MITAMLLVFASSATCSCSSATCPIALSAQPLLARKVATQPSMSDRPKSSFDSAAKVLKRRRVAALQILRLGQLLELRAELLHGIGVDRVLGGVGVFQRVFFLVVH